MAFSGLQSLGLISVADKWIRDSRKVLIDRIAQALARRLGLKRYEQRISAIERRLDDVASSVSTWAVSQWIEQAVLEKTPLISVILPTHNRSQILRRAVASVVAQAYPNWEIIVIDDGSTDDTPAVIAGLHDEVGQQRLRAIRIEPSGVCAARNHGLAAARGDFICYLDDDNIMQRLWLKAVAWAFAQRPDVDVLYGGIVIDDTLRLNRKSSGALPTYFLNPYDRQKLLRHNLADIGVLAHRSGIPEARFDESLREMGDWDLLVRITRAKSPLVLPVLACFYSTEGADRLSGGSTFDADLARVREKASKC